MHWLEQQLGQQRAPEVVAPSRVSRSVRFDWLVLLDDFCLSFDAVLFVSCGLEKFQNDALVYVFLEMRSFVS